MLSSYLLLALSGLHAAFGALNTSTGDGVDGIAKYTSIYRDTDLCGDVAGWRNETTALSPLKADCQEIWQLMNDSPGWLMFAYIGEWASADDTGLFPLVTVRTCTLAIRPFQWWEATTARLYVGSSDLNGIMQDALVHQGGVDRVAASGTMSCQERPTGEPAREIFFRIYNPNDQHPADYGFAW